MKLNDFHLATLGLDQLQPGMLYSRDIDDRPLYVMCAGLDYGADYRHAVLQFEVAIDLLEDLDPRSERQGQTVEGVIVRLALLPAWHDDVHVYAYETDVLRLDGDALEFLGRERETHTSIYKMAINQVVDTELQEFAVVQPRVHRHHYMRWWRLTEGHAFPLEHHDKVEGFTRQGRVHLLCVDADAQGFRSAEIDGAAYVTGLARLRDRLGVKWFDDCRRLREMDAYHERLLAA